MEIRINQFAYLKQKTGLDLYCLRDFLVLRGTNWIEGILSSKRGEN
jgi:hypothetical protein